MRLANPPENIIELTRLNPFGRFPDGRPHVPDEILEQMKEATTEEAWGVLRRNEYHYQFSGNWMNLHPEKILVGRAVTCQFVPTRPDLHNLIEETGKAEGRVGAENKHNSWVIDTLQPGDVLVVDLFGKVKFGTFAGDNLATSIHARSHTGMIIDGGIRDLQRILQLPDFGVFVRGVDPTPIRDVDMVAINIPIRVGEATVLPGDVVLGTPEGILFIPPHLAKEVVEGSALIRVRDEWGQTRMREGKSLPARSTSRSGRPRSKRTSSTGAKRPADSHYSGLRKCWSGCGQAWCGSGAYLPGAHLPLNDPANRSNR